MATCAFEGERASALTQAVAVPFPGNGPDGALMVAKGIKALPVVVLLGVHFDRVVVAA